MALSPAWKNLLSCTDTARARRIEDLFASTNRFSCYSRSIDGLLLDISKTSIDDADLNLLLALAEESQMTERIADMFEGKHLNVSENRPVLHTACRAGTDAPPEIRETLSRMRSFAQDLRSGSYKGHTGKPIRHVVNIGIGGSQLGPQMAAEALATPGQGPLVHFVGNVEGSDLARALHGIDISETLFVIASKSFTTPETMLNAHIAREAVLTHFNGDTAAIATHFVALSTQSDKVLAFGIAPAHMFPFREWVGGRFSGWSAIGLSVMLKIGPDAFDEWLAGAAAMDRHFRQTPLADNLPVLLALAGIWHRNVCGFPALAVIPYHSALARFPAWMQQIDMESNGKSVTREGGSATLATGPLVFGAPGTDAQHSFFQWLHQSTDTAPVEFIGIAQPTAGTAEQHRMLTAHLLAQSESLMRGQANTAEPHRNFPGNRPSVTILIDALTPYHLGQLMALYEHKIFVQGHLWGINSFDQFGVELGKTVAAGIEDELAGSATGSHDGSTVGLMRYISARQPS